MTNESLIALPGCPGCRGIKKIIKNNKKWKNVRILSTGTKEGFALAEKLNVTRYPQCFTINKKGKPVKCNTVKFLKKFGITMK